jgi:hypothetical protein
VGFENYYKKKKTKYWEIWFKKLTWFEKLQGNKKLQALWLFTTDKLGFGILFRRM